MRIKDLFEDAGFDNIVAFSGTDITDELINRCLKLDSVFYKDNYLWKEFNIADTIKKYSQMCFILLDEEQSTIVGYSYWFPIKSQILNEFIENKKILLNITPEYCTGYKTSPINLFCAGEAFVPGYDLLNLHKVLEDIFQYHILCLAQYNIKVDTISFDAVCDYDEQYLVARTGLDCVIKKDDSNFYYGKYSPRVVYNQSQYCKELMKYYD